MNLTTRRVYLGERAPESEVEKDNEGVGGEGMTLFI